MSNATISISRRATPRSPVAIALLIVLLASFAARAGQTVANTLVEEAYQRMHTMIRASHVLLATPPMASAETIAMTTSFAYVLKQSIERGERSFEETARLFSDDPSVTINQGDLGYFTVFEQPYAIENAAYQTAVGTVSDPVRSRFGVHLVMPTERVPVSGVKSVAHIMLNHSDDARQRIAEIHGTVNAKNFGTIARALSEDPRSRDEGGMLGTDRLIDSLEAVRLQLEPGEISAPVESPSGWHILMITGFEPFPPVTEIRPQLIKQIARDGRDQIPPLHD